MDLILSKDDQINVWDFSVKLSKSQMVPKTFFQKPEDVFVTVLYGRELGMSPIIALNSICVIQGQVTLKVNTMTGIVLKNHPKAVIDIKQDETKKEVVISFKRDPSDSAPYVSTWNMEKAKALGLAGKANYQSQPLTMLRARALSEGYRIKFGDTLLGFYSSEEMEDSLPPIKNDPLIDLQQAAREDAERMRLEQSKPEDSIVGPLYLVQNGKFRGLRLHEIDLIELEAYKDDLTSRKSQKSWEVELMQVLQVYFTNYKNYAEQVAELNGIE